MSTTVLLIEDDAENLEKCRDALQHSGFDLLHALDGDSGILIARDRTPAFILVDLTVPGRDGLLIVRHLQSDPATSAIPVVALTHGDAPADRRMAMEAGCHGYLPKSNAPEIRVILD